MKQLLFVAVIHLLILHQCQKDKKEALAQKKISANITATVNWQPNWLTDIKSYKNDSLHYPVRYEQPADITYQHSVYLYR